MGKLLRIPKYKINSTSLSVTNPHGKLIGKLLYGVVARVKQSDKYVSRLLESDRTLKRNNWYKQIDNCSINMPYAPVDIFSEFVMQKVNKLLKAAEKEKVPLRCALYENAIHFQLYAWETISLISEDCRRFGENIVIKALKDTFIGCKDYLNLRQLYAECRAEHIAGARVRFPQRGQSSSGSGYRNVPRNQNRRRQNKPCTHFNNPKGCKFGKNCWSAHVCSNCQGNHPRFKCSSLANNNRGGAQMMYAPVAMPQMGNNFRNGNNQGNRKQSNQYMTFMRTLPPHTQWTV